MKIKKRKMKPMLYGTALAIALSFGSPGLVGAEQAADTARENSDKTAVADQQSEDVPVAEIEVQEKKEKEKKEEDLSIGQQPNAEGVHNYVVTRSSTGSKTDAESKDVPQSIAVVGQKVIKEQHADTVAKVLTNVAGVNTGTGTWNPNANLNPSFFIRGFTANNYYVDGLYDAAAGVSGWTGNLDRIEVLKGTSSLFFGQAQPGGIINYITKKPLTEEKYTFGLEYGSWGSRSLDLDASIPLTQDKKWLSRTIIETDRLEQFQKNVNNNHFNGSIIVQGKPKDDTVYTFEATYNNYNLAGGYIGGLPTVGTILPPYGIVPYDGNYYDPSLRYYFIGRSLSGRVDHKVNDTWTVTSALRYSDSHNDRSYLGDERWLNGDYTTGKIRSYYSWDIFDVNTLAWDTTGSAKFKTGTLDHNLVLGYEWSRYRRTWPVSVGTSLTPVDAYNPVWDPRPILPIEPWKASSLYRYGTYVSDTITVSDRWKVTGGINRATYSEGIGGSGVKTSGTSWRLGTTYAATPGVTWFAGYATSFDYNSSSTIKVGGTSVGTQFFKPKTGYQIEGGVKYDISNKASVTLARYNIHQKNIVANLGTSNDTDYQLIGEQASRGYDLDANYVIKPGWNVLAAYSHIDSTTVNDPAHPAWIGKQTTSVPEQTFRLWSTYEIQDGPRKGLGFGGGITYVSRRPFNSDNSIWIPGYQTYDAIVYYKTKEWNYSLNLYNLTNKQYWVAQTGVEVYAGTPRSFTLRAEKTF